jgi:hypothetical protein
MIMARTISQKSRDELVRLGDEIYENKVRPKLKKSDLDRFVAIDVLSGEWTIGDTEMEAYDRLRERHPDAQTWLTRAGRTYLHSFGGRELRSDAE